MHDLRKIKQDSSGSRTRQRRTYRTCIAKYCLNKWRKYNLCSPLYLSPARNIWCSPCPPVNLHIFSPLTSEFRMGRICRNAEFLTAWLLTSSFSAFQSWFFPGYQLKRWNFKIEIPQFFSPPASCPTPCHPPCHRSIINTKPSLDIFIAQAIQGHLATVENGFQGASANGKSTKSIGTK